jgi:hypothetical protein
MARNVTVQEIVDEVQILVEDPLHKLATEPSYVRLVNRAYARLHAFYVAAEPDRYRTEATITAITGTAAYAMPADWLSTIGVDAVVNGTSREELQRLQEEERNDYIGQSGQARAFRDLATNVVLYPTPLTGQTYIHIYLPTAPVLILADLVDLRIGHEDWLEKVVARVLLSMKNEYRGQWDADIDKLELELRGEANLRYFTDCVTMMQKRNRRPWPYGPAASDIWPGLGRSFR